MASLGDAEEHCKSSPHKLLQEAVVEKHFPARFAMPSVKLNQADTLERTKAWFPLAALMRKLWTEPHQMAKAVTEMQSAFRTVDLFPERRVSLTFEITHRNSRLLWPGTEVPQEPGGWQALSSTQRGSEEGRARWWDSSVMASKGRGLFGGGGNCRSSWAGEEIDDQTTSCPLSLSLPPTHHEDSFPAHHSLDATGSSDHTRNLWKLGVNKPFLPSLCFSGTLSLMKADTATWTE